MRVHTFPRSSPGNETNDELDALALRLDAKPFEPWDCYRFLTHEFPPRQTMLSPWLPEKGVTMIHGPRGVGKTHVCLGVAWAIATGAEFLKWKAEKPRRVLLLDGEMPAVVLQERLKAIAEAHNDVPQWDNLKIAAADLREEGLPDLANPDAQDRFYGPIVEEADYISVDNISTLCPNLKENEAESWTPIQKWALKLRRAGKSVTFFHHSGKTGQQRGTSRREDILDTVIALRKPIDYSAENGARFEVHFEKNRGFHGKDAEPFEATLTENKWSIGAIKVGEDAETLRAFKASGMSLRDIAERTGIPKTTIARRLEEGE